MEPLLKKMQMMKCHLLKTSSDEDVKMLYEARERREEALSSPANPNLVTRGQWQPTVELTAEPTTVELNSGYGVYEADLIARSIPDETAIPSDGPILICAEISVST